MAEGGERKAVSAPPLHEEEMPSSSNPQESKKTKKNIGSKAEGKAEDAGELPFSCVKEEGKRRIIAALSRSDPEAGRVSAASTLVGGEGKSTS